MKRVLERINFEHFGIVGSATILACFVISAVGYKGIADEGYSIANHFVSELGVSGISPLAPVFNAGLIAGGLLLLLFIIGLSRLLSTRLAGVMGTISAVSCSFVGVFPAEESLIIGHAIAALTFFFVAAVTILVFTIVILLQKEVKVSKRMALPGFVVAGIFGLFLSLSFSGGGNFTSFTDMMLNRPEFWLAPFLEWLAVLSITGWLLVVALYQFLRERGMPPDRGP